MSVRLLNIATVAVATLFFAAFVILAEGLGGDDDNDDRLEAIATTTTAVTLPRVATSTTTLAIVPPTPVTITPLFPPTTAARTTATVRRPTTTQRRSSPTTRRPTNTTASTVPSGPNGRVTEASDNTASFTHNSDGSTSASASPVSANPGALVFKVAAQVVSTSGSSADVRFTVDITNQRGRRVSFPDGLRVTLTVTPSGGAPFTIDLDAREVAFIENRETVTVVSTAVVQGHGEFSVSGSVEVDYGS